MATLTYIYAESVAVVEPLTESDGPHSWDLCEAHALRITAPRNWELVRHWSPVDVTGAGSAAGPDDVSADASQHRAAEPGAVATATIEFGAEPDIAQNRVEIGPGHHVRRAHLRALPAPGAESPVW